MIKSLVWGITESSGMKVENDIISAEVYQKESGIFTVKVTTVKGTVYFPADTVQIGMDKVEDAYLELVKKQLREHDPLNELFKEPDWISTVSVENTYVMYSYKTQYMNAIYRITGRDEFFSLVKETVIDVKHEMCKSLLLAKERAIEMMKQDLLGVTEDGIS
jgi:hypothetical protein